MIDGENIVDSCNLRDGDKISRANKACDFMASACGMSLAGTDASDDGLEVYRYYTYGSDMGLRLYYRTDLTSTSIGFMVAYKDADGKFNTPYTSCGGMVILGSGDYSDSSEDYVTLYSTRLQFGNLAMTRFKMQGNFGNFMFMPFNTVDYFSGKTRTGMYVGGKNCYVYNDANKLLEPMSEVVLGGITYPSGGPSKIAAPVVLKTPSFYGCMNNASSLYYVTGVSSSFGNMIQIGGVNFRHLYLNWFIRC